ncbi:SMP-30/gluconolactonase/LRE family protein [Chitinophaga japonensis]|uniref:Sugar lactone lactonase YvrE n=1 Tax=Chitinophaga japonensis TaxID=104662 RepID=A0A562SI40_CHIJA|nr:hypothetical protein [Chitinophaga japonensis]TWI80858.1 hypothetical protein LX66_5463 [Chitinophaga japonensis]
MQKVLLCLAGLLLASHSFAQDGLVHPESLISDGHFLYATNIGTSGDPTARDGDGFISKLSLGGNMITPSITTEKLNAPKGTAIIKGVLYVADLDRIVGIRLSSGKKVAEISLADFHTSFANDLTVKDDHTLFVSLTDAGKILEADVKSLQVKAVTDLPGANGIYYDQKGHRLYTCNFHFDNIQGGEIGVVHWEQQQAVYEKLSDAHGGFDGLVMTDDHTLLVSDWGALDHPAGLLQKIDIPSKTVTQLEMPVIAGPADFYYDAARKRLYIPVMLESKVLIKDL